MWRDSVNRSYKRFSYLLLDEGEFYVQDWIATCRQGSLDGTQRIRPPPWQLHRMKGCLRLCSKSIFFEPDDLSAPIIRFPMNKVKKVEALTETPISPNYVQDKWSAKQEGFVLEASLHVTMKDNGIDAPYIFEKQDSIWWFALEFSPVQKFLKQAQSFLSINLLPNMERDMVLYNTRAQKEAQAFFDTTSLVDLSEKICLDVSSAQVTPLVREPGRLVVTQTRLYFQPLYNLNDNSPVRSQPLNAIIAMASRRHALRQIGLEIFFKEGDCPFRNAYGCGLSYGASAFFTFQNVQERDIVVAKLLEKLKGEAGSSHFMESLLEGDTLTLQSFTKAWQEHRISNYDYLMYLNLAAGRSFCDLTQWPVMPWILKDYRSETLDLDDPKYFRDLSKPIGALNPDRLAVFRDRYREMLEGSTLDPAFLYGTHYSTPGYVLYWLVRSAPAHMLRLQNGRFDTPDRLFVSMEESWENVMNNAADLKELIPEFFSLPSDFLRIRDGLKLGVRQRGDPVGDVILPPWAKDADDFIIKHRQALECAHVSQHLHEWIDLIFGFKQRGRAALAADNLFHFLSYEGTMDLEKIDDPVQRASIEVQIHEFGQVPQQRFLEPHPVRFPCETKDGAASSSPMQIDFGGLIYRLTTLASSINNDISFEYGKARLPSNLVSGHKQALGMTDMPYSSFFANNHIENPGTTSLREDMVERIQIGGCNNQNTEIRVVNNDSDSTLESESCLEMNCKLQIQDIDQKYMVDEENSNFSGSIGSTSINGNHLASMLIQETVDIEIMRNANKLEDTGHHDSAWHYVLQKCISEPQSLKMHRGPVCAVVLSEDNASECLTMFSVGRDGFIKVYSISDGLQVRSTKLGNLPLSSLALARSMDAYPTVLAGSYDNCVYAYSVDYGRALGKARVHEDTVSCLRIIESSSQQIVTASWDATVKIWSIDEGRGGWATAFGSSKNISNASMEFVEHDGAVLCLDVGYENNILISGSKDGTVIAWDPRTPTSIWHQNHGSKGPASGLQLKSDSKEVVVVFEDGSLCVLDVRKGGSLLVNHQCENPLRCCEVSGPLLLAGSATGTLHFWSLELDKSNRNLEAYTTLKYHDYSPVQDHDDAINCISVYCKASETMAHVATASEDGIVHLYNAVHQ